MNRVKIVCTIGPSSASPNILENMLKHGMSLARLNMSHGTREWHQKTIRLIRKIEKKHQRPIPILLDLQGPRIRVGSISPEGMYLQKGETVLVVPTQSSQRPKIPNSNVSNRIIPIELLSMTKALKRGSTIMINDGLVELKVRRQSSKGLQCNVAVGGHVSSHKGVNLPGAVMRGPALTAKDRKDMEFGLQNKVEFFALSFVRSSNDVRMAKAYLRKKGQDIPLIAKIERPEAIKDLKNILNEAEGVMLARGDLALEMSLEAVPVLQKQILEESNRRYRFGITATQMLESMTTHPLPTRAEASDVANAVLDGSDALMLSAETSTGQYPVEAVQVMARVIGSAEQGEVFRWVPDPSHAFQDVSLPASMCMAANVAGRLNRAKAIVVFTESGSMALLMSKQRPNIPIIALTPSAVSVRRMRVFWGVSSYQIPRLTKIESKIAKAEAILKRHDVVVSGDRIVIVVGERGQNSPGANLIKVHGVT